MSMTSSRLVLIAACAMLFTAPAFAADTAPAAPAKPAAAAPAAAAPAKAAAKKHHHKMTCSDYAYQSKAAADCMAKKPMKMEHKKATKAKKAKPAEKK